MAIKIITDSASDISQEMAKEMGITVLPLTIRFGNKEYTDGITLTNEEFYYQLVHSNEFPKTSQISPFTYEEVFRKAIADGSDVVYIGISSDVSGSLQNAELMAAQFDGKVQVVDSRNFCISMYALVGRALQLRDNDHLDAASIAQTLREEIRKLHIISIFDTLEFLKKGGRLSSAAAFAGGLLNIKPVISIGDGIVKVIGKARGTRNGFRILKDYIQDLGGIDFSKPVAFGFTGAGRGEELLHEFIAESKEIYAGFQGNNGHAVTEIPILHVGATVGTYAGPGAFATTFFSK